MNKFKKTLLIILGACCALACVAATACSATQNWRVPHNGVVNNGTIDANNPNGDLPFYYPEGTDPDDYLDKENAYTITTVSMGGLSISGMRITIKHEGETVIEGISLNGGAVFGIPAGEYDIEYSNLPLGYSEDENGTVKHLTADNLQVKTAFTSSVIRTETPAGKTYALGDVMYNFSVTDADGNTMNLAEILQTKRAVLLNFWAIRCMPCRAEFPIIDTVYAGYKDKLEVIAISNEDSNASIKKFKEQYGHSFFMAHDSAGVFNRFNTESIPVSVMVDRYGVVSYYNVGSETSETKWDNIFSTFTADNYEQSIQQGSGGETGSEDPVAPPADAEMPADAALNGALLDASMDGTELHYYEPAEDTRDGKFNWPFTVNDSDSDGACISPSNVGTDNTWSIMYTDVELNPDQTLSVDVKVQGDPDDILYIVLNNSADLSFTYSGNTNGWQTVELFTSTRLTSINLTIFYIKSVLGSPDNEFVGLKNLKIFETDYYSSTSPLDVRTEAVRIENDEPVYPTVYKGQDGFYRIQQGAEENETTDPWLFADILSASLWSDRHLADYNLVNVDNGQSVELVKSLYLISFWHPDFGNGGAADFKYGLTETDTVIDCYWVQDGTNYMSAVDETLANALKAFAARASTHIAEYKGGHNENTWLELCSYYRTLGGDHTADGHTCLVRQNMGVGKTLNYAIEATQGDKFTVDLRIAQKKNRAGGVFYKFTAPQTGVYVFTSYRPFSEEDPIDPNLLIWPAGSNAYNDSIILEQSDCHSYERFANNDDNKFTNNFQAYLYLTEGTTIYPQFTVASGDISQLIDQYISSGIDVTYQVDIKYLGESKHVLTLAATDGMWDSMTEYAGIDVVADGAEASDLYYHVLPDNSYGSVIYIDFIHPNYVGLTSLKDLIDRGVFDLSESGGGNFTAKMNEYWQTATSKSQDDPTYGMCEASVELVQILSEGLRVTSDDGDGLESGLWKAFAYYWQYYGSTAWEPVEEA